MRFVRAITMTRLRPKKLTHRSRPRTMAPRGKRRTDRYNYNNLLRSLKCISFTCTLFGFFLSLHCVERNSFKSVSAHMGKKQRHQQQPMCVYIYIYVYTYITVSASAHFSARRSLLLARSLSRAAKIRVRSRIYARFPPQTRHTHALVYRHTSEVYTISKFQFFRYTRR